MNPPRRLRRLRAVVTAATTLGCSRFSWSLATAFVPAPLSTGARRPPPRATFSIDAFAVERGTTGGAEDEQAPRTSIRLWAATAASAGGGVDAGTEAPASSSTTTSGKNGRSKRRPPPSKRMALRWVVEGAEKILLEEQRLRRQGSEIDAPATDDRQKMKPSDDKDEDGEDELEDGPSKELINALWDLVFGRTQKDLTRAGRLLEEIDIPRVASFDVQERIVKATAAAGLTHISLDVLRNMLRGGPPDDAGGINSEEITHRSRPPRIPSAVAYTALLNGLRRTRQLRAMEEVLTDLAEATRRKNRMENELDGEEVSPGGGGGVDIVAFNTYLAALCDAAVSSYEAASSKRKADRTSAPLRDDALAAAAELLRPGVARDRFALCGARVEDGDEDAAELGDDEPDLRSYNTVLTAAARIGNRTVSSDVWDLMFARGMRGDAYTYNARIRAALSAENAGGGRGKAKGPALELVLEALSDPEIEPDRYTIDLALVPLARDGRYGRILKALGNFELRSAERETGLYVGALSSFLATLVKAGEIEMARNVFGGFVLPLLMGNGTEATEGGGLNLDEFGVQRELATLPRVRPKRLTRHFNILIEGYRRLGGDTNNTAPHVEDTSGGSKVDEKADAAGTDSESEAIEHISPNQHAADLFRTMTVHGVPIDPYTLTSMLGTQTSPEGITSFLRRALSDPHNAELNPIVYRAILTAYGKANDPSSACWIFDRMGRDCIGDRRIKGWNCLLGALSTCSLSSLTLDASSSRAAVALEEAFSTRIKNDESHQFTHGLADILNGETCASSARIILDTMSRKREGGDELFPARPNSQTYCLVAAALVGDGESGAEAATALFREAMNAGIPADGRFLNAVIRCFGNELDAALKSWKAEMRPAAIAHENRERGGGGGGAGGAAASLYDRRRRRGKNLLAAYHGLFHVCGTAGRPDVALRLTYAMAKEGLEATETSLNCYNAGKKSREQNAAPGEVASGGGGIRAKWFESLLNVECTKYDQNDMRRSDEKRIRIIF